MNIKDKGPYIAFNTKEQYNTIIEAFTKKGWTRKSGNAPADKEAETAVFEDMDKNPGETIYIEYQDKFGYTDTEEKDAMDALGIKVITFEEFQAMEASGEAPTDTRRASNPFRVGDRVKFKDLETLRKLDEEDECSWAPSMDPLSGREATIAKTKLLGDNVLIFLKDWSDDSGDIYFFFTQRMFEPVGFTIPDAPEKEKEENDLDPMEMLKMLLNMKTKKGK